jgi:hypothetical protein
MPVCLECERLQRSYSEATTKREMSQRWLARYRGPGDVVFPALWEQSVAALRASYQIREQMRRHTADHKPLTPRGMAAAT